MPLETYQETETSPALVYRTGLSHEPNLRAPISVKRFRVTLSSNRRQELLLYVSFDAESKGFKK